MADLFMPPAIIYLQVFSLNILTELKPSSPYGYVARSLLVFSLKSFASSTLQSLSMQVVVLLSKMSFGHPNLPGSPKSTLGCPSSAPRILFDNEASYNISPQMTMSNVEKYFFALGVSSGDKGILFSSKNCTLLGGNDGFIVMFRSSATAAKGSMSFAITQDAPAIADAILHIPQPLPISITDLFLNNSGESRIYFDKNLPPGQQNAHHGSGNGNSFSSRQ
jgi:hypothetical protein